MEQTLCLGNDEHSAKYHPSPISLSSNPTGSNAHVSADNLSKTFEHKMYTSTSVVVTPLNVYTDVVNLGLTVHDAHYSIQ